METIPKIRLPKRSLSSQSCGKCRQLNQNNQKTEMQANDTQKVALIHSTKEHTQKMLTGKSQPGLVAIYDIQARNGVCLFLQPHSPHMVGFP